MRTSFDLPEPLFAQAKRAAQETGVTMRELVIQGLTDLLARRSGQARTRFQLADASVAGHGLHPGIADLRAESLRNLIHPETASRTSDGDAGDDDNRADGQPSRVADRPA